MAIGTTTAILGLAGAGATIAAGAMQSSAADKASRVQAQSTDEALDFQREAFGTTRQDSLPWLNVGKQAMFAYGQELGLDLDPADFGEGFTPAERKDFRETPGYQFNVEEGEKGVLNNLAALGMKNSGSALKALTRFRTGLADQTHQNYLTRLSGMSGMGQGQANALSSLSMNNAANQGNLLMESGRQRASGYVGGANAWSNTLSNLSNTSFNALGRMNQQNTPNSLPWGK